MNGLYVDAAIADADKTNKAIIHVFIAIFLYLFVIGKTIFLNIGIEHIIATINVNISMLSI